MNASVKVLAALLALVALVLAGFAVRLAMNPAPAPVVQAAAVTTFPVVVTTRPVMAGQRLATEDLRVERLPMQPAGAHADAAGLVGQRAALDLGAGVPVLDTLTSSGLALRVAAGERAVAVRVDEAIGIGHRVRPGDVVDLFLMLKQDGKEIGYTQSRLLLPALRVLGYGGESVDGPAHVTDAPVRDGQTRREAARTAVLSVPLAQVNQLLLGASSGQLAMALRHPDDHEVPAAAYTSLPTALPLHAVRGADPMAADRAAAGVRLDTLAGLPRAASIVNVARHPATPQAATAAIARAPAAERVEVIRPSGRESIPY
jgi:pilus assembly protein CpaB